MRETEYRRKLVKKLTRVFPGCFIFENDPSRNQGVPDLLILFKGFWAMLELKRSASASMRPNQNYHIKHFNNMSFAALIYPENEEQVLSDLQSAFGVGRATCVSKSK
jgi:hypothetical protein